MWVAGQQEMGETKSSQSLFAFVATDLLIIATDPSLLSQDEKWPKWKMEMGFYIFC